MVLPICFVMIKVAASQYLGQVAQLVEHGPEKAGVGGSSPPLTTFLPALGSPRGEKFRKSPCFAVFLPALGFSLPQHATFRFNSRNFPHPKRAFDRCCLGAFQQFFWQFGVESGDLTISL